MSYAKIAFSMCLAFKISQVLRNEKTKEEYCARTPYSTVTVISQTPREENRSFASLSFHVGPHLWRLWFEPAGFILPVLDV